MISQTLSYCRGTIVHPYHLAQCRLGSRPTARIGCRDKEKGEQVPALYPAADHPEEGRVRSVCIATLRNMNASGSNQGESEPFTLVRGGDELSPSSSQFGIASDHVPHATASLHPQHPMRCMVVVVIVPITVGGWLRNGKSSARVRTGIMTFVQS